MAAKPRSEWSPAYRRRIERAEARGLTRAQARGHRNESQEKRERRRRTHEQYGASPERMARLRREAKRHMLDQLSSGSKGRVNERTIEQGIKLLPADVIEEFLLPASGDQIRAFARYSYEELILRYPEFENDAERNPFWYH